MTLLEKSPSRNLTLIETGPACVGLGDLFFGPDKERPGRRRRREEQAKACCATCPQLLTCRQTARENLEHGIWGGETEEERALAGFAPLSASRRSVLDAKRQFEEASD